MVQTLCWAVTGAMTPAGINLSGLLPSGGLLPNALPGAVQSASQAGVPFGLKNTSSLRPLNLLQLPGGSLIFNTLQQQRLSQFTPQQPQQPQQPTTSSPQQPGEQVCPFYLPYDMLCIVELYIFLVYSRPISSVFRLFEQTFNMLSFLY